jgi:hypothetical protein
MKHRFNKKFSSERIFENPLSKKILSPGTLNQGRLGGVITLPISVAKLHVAKRNPLIAS